MNKQAVLKFMEERLGRLSDDQKSAVKEYVLSDPYIESVIMLNRKWEMEPCEVWVVMSNRDRSVIIYREGEDGFGYAGREGSAYEYVGSGTNLYHVFGVSEINE